MVIKVTEKLVSLFHLDKGDRKKNYGYFEGILSIVINIILFLVKFIFGVVLKSVALLADAVHSLSDVVTSVIVIFGFRISAKPPDPEHPFGHGRAERVVSIVIACLLIVVGFEFFISGFNRFKNPIPIKADLFIILLLILSILVKEFLSQVALSLGKRIGSSSLKAEAWHHRTDAISTALVIVGFILYRFELYYIDGIIGMIIAVFITYMGISIIKESGSVLIGEAPSSSFVKKIREIALGCGGISDVHHIHVHDYGGRLEITVHIRLKKDTHLDEAHKKASEVEIRLKEEIKGAEITVHLEPDFKDG